MPKFDYAAKTSDGGLVRGTADADSEEALVRRLREKGFWVQRIERHCEAQELAGDAPPIQRVIDVILRTAIKEGVEHVDIEPHEGGVSVFYTVGEQRREAMTVPSYVWPPLLNAYCELASAPEPQEGSETGGTFEFEEGGRTYEILFMGSPSGARLEINPG